MKTILFKIILFFCISTIYSQQQKTVGGPIFEHLGATYSIENADLLLETNKKYKVIFDVYSDEKKSSKMNPLINTVARFMNMHAQHGVPLENMEIVLVLHGPATKNALNEQQFEKLFKSKHPNHDLINALSEKNVQIFVCGQSMKSKGYKAADISENVGVSLSALTALVKYQSEGYQIINFN